MNTNQHLDPPGADDPAPRQAAVDLLADLDGLYDLAIRAEQLARLVGVHGSAHVLDDHQLSALEQARSNASAIIASLDRAR